MRPRARRAGAGRVSADVDTDRREGQVRNDNGLIGLWIAVVVLLGLLVSGAATAIALGGGYHTAGAVFAGGGAFSATVTLGILIINALRGR